MNRRKITVVGAGNVGAATAQLLAYEQIADVVIVDIVDGLAAGKALDLNEAAPVQKYNSRLTGTSDWNMAANSDIVIITSGMPRKPGMSRDDLLAKNVEIVSSVSEQIKDKCPDSIVIVVANPLDAMVYTAAKVTGFPKNRVMGMAGALDSARFCSFIAEELNVSPEEVHSVLMGGHGDDMVPLPRYTSVAGIPLTELMDDETILKLVERTRKGGIEVVNLMNTSAYYAPAAGAVKMAVSILMDRKYIISSCVYCQKEYGIEGHFVGVPAVLGANGVEKVLEIELNQDEKAMLDNSVAHVKQLVGMVESLI